MQNLDKLILRKLCQISAKLGNQTENAISYIWGTACSDTGETKIVRYSYDNNGTLLTTVYYNPDGSLYTGTIGTCASTDVVIESDAVKFCDNGNTILRWYVKNNGTPTGVVYDTDLNNNILIFSNTAVLGDCLSTNPGIHLIENVQNGTFSSPFNANCVTVSYDTLTPGAEEIKVELIGAISGNKTYKVYGNTQEQICFDSTVIQGVTIIGYTTGNIDIEFKSK